MSISEGILLPFEVKSIGLYENPDSLCKPKPQSLCSPLLCKLNIDRISSL